MGRDVVEATRLRQEVDQRRLAPPDHRREAVEAFEERGAPLQHADVMERSVPARRQLPHHGERVLEVLERRPGVAVVGPEAREIDVPQVEDVVGLDVEEAVSAGVAWRVDDADAHPTQIEDVTVGKRARVRARREMELLDDRAGEGVAPRAGESVDGHQAVERPDAGQVRLRQAPRRRRVEMVPGHVVLVTVAVQDPVGLWRPARATHQRERRIDHDGFMPAAALVTASASSSCNPSSTKSRVPAQHTWP